MKKQFSLALIYMGFILMCGVTLTRCKVETNPDASEVMDGTLEIGNQIADVMSSIDEMGKGTGTIQTMATCYGNGFGACAGNSVTRTFAGCTNGTSTFTGTVSMTWGGTSAACVLQNPGDYIQRNPNFTDTGGRAGTLAVFKNATLGEKLTWMSGANPKVFQYSSDGIRKTINVAGTLGYDTTTLTAGNITVTGQDRTGRVMTGGTLEIINNINGVICTVSPQSVTWSDANCTCGSSGSWQGTCLDGSLIRMDLLSCGHAQMTLGSYSESITLDRCQNN